MPPDKYLLISAIQGVLKVYPILFRYFTPCYIKFYKENAPGKMTIYNDSFYAA